MEISPESWSWIWLAAAALFITGETFVAGTFILIPFGISAILAMILALLGAPVYVGWLVCRFIKNNGVDRHDDIV